MMTVTVTVLESDLEDAIDALWCAHGDRCLSADNCSCEAEIGRLRAALQESQERGPR